MDFWKKDNLIKKKLILFFIKFKFNTLLIHFNNALNENKSYAIQGLFSICSDNHEASN